jgi:hypothetical protein
MIAKNVCALIILSVALIPFESSAQEAGVDGKANAADVVVTTVGGALVNWNTLVSLEIVIPAHQIWHCVATASADALNPGGLDNRYRFTLTRNDTSPVVGAGCERTIDIDDNAGVNDATNHVVATTCPFLNVNAGTHTIRFLATKVTSGDSNMIIDDSSLTVVCTKKQL